MKKTKRRKLPWPFIERENDPSAGIWNGLVVLVPIYLIAAGAMWLLAQGG